MLFASNMVRAVCTRIPEETQRHLQGTKDQAPLIASPRFLPLTKQAYKNKTLRVLSAYMHARLIHH